MLPLLIRFRLITTRSLLLLGAGLGACATPHPLTQANEQQSTMTITVYNRQLNTSLLLNGKYDLNLQPPNRPDAVTKTRLKQLALPRRQAAVLFTAQTNLAPTYRLRAVRVAGNPDWKSLGFQENGTGRYQRTATAGSDLLMEYAAPLPEKQGWLYLLATDEAKSRPDASVKERSREMDAEFVTFTFPSVQQGRWPRILSPGWLANDAFLSRPNGDYLAPLVALSQSRHSPPGDPSLDGTLWYLLQQYHSIAGNLDSLEYFQQLGPSRVRLPAPPAPERPEARRIAAAPDTLVAVEAVPEILRRAAGARAVLLDESHIHGRDRALAAALLPGLYQQGFRYLALETLEDSATSQVQPLPLQAGVYTREATFANLVRTARRLGFTLVAYQNTGQQRERALQQATTLYRVLQQNPQARLLVYGHDDQATLRLRGNIPNKRLSQHLADLLGQPVLRINQTRMSNEARGTLALTAPGTAEVVYQLRRGQRVSPHPGSDLVVRNNLALQQLPLPYLDATDARPVSLDVRPYRPTSTTGRRLIQLYMQSELTIREDIAPIYTHEVHLTDEALPLRLVPGRYVYRVVSEKVKEEVRQELEVK